MEDHERVLGKKNAIDLSLYIYEERNLANRITIHIVGLGE
jgi:hypothetical protein